MKLIAYSYIRLSTDIQSYGDSRRRQIEATKKYAEELGYEYKDSLEDIGVSAYKSKNVKEGELGRFIYAIETGLIDPNKSALFIESLDRLTRDAALKALTLFTRLLETGLTIVTTMDRQTYTTESFGKNPNQLYLALAVLLRANEESETKSKRLKQAWKNKRENLSVKKLTSVSPAWMSLSEDKSEFALKNNEANTVRKIFSLCIDDNLGQYAITKYLNNNLDNYPVFTKPTKANRNKISTWNQSYISKILHNISTYGCFQPHTTSEGKRIPHGEVIEDYYPAAITENDFLVAQARMSKRKHKGGGRKGDEFTNLFTKLTICGECGSTVVYQNKGDGTKGGKYLKCGKSEMSNECSSPPWRYDEFEQSFFQFITEINLSDIIDRKNSNEEIKELQRNNDLLNEELKISQKAYEAISSNLQEVDASIVKDVLQQMESTKININRLRNEVSNNNILINELVDSSKTITSKSLLDNIKRLNSIEDKKNRYQIRLKLHNEISQLIDSIVVHNKELNLHPTEMISEMSIHLGEKIWSEGISTEERFLKYLASPRGKRRFNKSQRYYIINFVSGEHRAVLSGETTDGAIMYSDKMKKLIHRMKSQK